MNNNIWLHRFIISPVLLYFKGSVSYEFLLNSPTGALLYYHSIMSDNQELEYAPKWYRNRKDFFEAKYPGIKGAVLHDMIIEKEDIMTDFLLDN